MSGGNRMKSEIGRTLTANFEGHEVGNEFADFGKSVALGCGSGCEIDEVDRRHERRARRK